jgi:hypothetical protein
VDRILDVTDQLITYESIKMLMREYEAGKTSSESEDLTPPSDFQDLITKHRQVVASQKRRKLRKAKKKTD